MPETLPTPSPELAQGAVAAFTSPEALVNAVRILNERGFGGAGRLHAYTPYPLPELGPLLGLRRSRIPLVAFAAGITGCFLAFVVVYWTNGVDYPLDVGGRPLNSFPADIPILFETSILFAACAAFALVLGRSGLPRLTSPVQRVAGFESASSDEFWLGVATNAHDGEVAQLLHELGARVVRDVPAREEHP